MMQRQRDVAAGLNTACFISGYRGSPLAGLDQGLWRAKPSSSATTSSSSPASTRTSRATALWGSQQVNLFEGAKYDGVFAHVVRQGPGRRPLRRRVQARQRRRHVEARRRAGARRRRPRRGLSTLPHQSEHEFISAMIPVLNPSGVQEFLDLGSTAGR
jgi:indolepyruvate ferredoxin oxidoreductase